MLFYKQYYFVGDSIRDSVVNMVAAVLGMIPEGLVLLTSVALTLGALKLAHEEDASCRSFTVLRLWHVWIHSVWIRQELSQREHVCGVSGELSAGI